MPAVLASVEAVLGLKQLQEVCLGWQQEGLLLLPGVQKGHLLRLQMD
jgi:hypothetical protein